MAEKKKLDAVPEVVIDVELPQIPEDKVLMAFASPWKNAEREYVLGILTTAAIRSGKWCAVDTCTFGTILRQGPWSIMAQGVINATWALADESYLDIVTVNEEDYLVPSAKMAEMLTQCQLRYA